jgi:hypothetical protein
MDNSLWCLIVSVRQGNDYTQADPNWLVLGAPTDSAGLTDVTHFSKYYENWLKFLLFNEEM